MMIFTKLRALCKTQSPWKKVIRPQFCIPTEIVGMAMSSVATLKTYQPSSKKVAVGAPAFRKQSPHFAVWSFNGPNPNNSCCHQQSKHLFNAVLFNLMVSRLFTRLTPDLGSKAKASSTPGTTSPIVVFTFTI